MVQLRRFRDTETASTTFISDVKLFGCGTDGFEISKNFLHPEPARGGFKNDILNECSPQGLTANKFLLEGKVCKEIQSLRKQSRKVKFPR